MFDYAIVDVLIKTCLQVQSEQTVTIMDNTLNEALEKLAVTEPAEPRGWFRWLHNHYLGRYGEMHPGIVLGCYAEGVWKVISDKPEPLYKRIDDPDLLLAVLNLSIGIEFRPTIGVQI